MRYNGIEEGGYVDSHVRITQLSVFYGRCGIVVEAEDDRQVANVLLDERDRILPPPYFSVSTVEEDYEFLELISASTPSAH
jgi:hypothetical protein